jgi:hypothetical protein
MAKKLDKMTVDELTAEIVKLSNEREALRNQQAEVSRVRDGKLTEQYERERLAAAGFSAERIDAIVSVNTQVAGSEAQSNG